MSETEDSVFSQLGYFLRPLRTLSNVSFPTLVSKKEPLYFPRRNSTSICSSSLKESNTGRTFSTIDWMSCMFSYFYVSRDSLKCFLYKYCNERFFKSWEYMLLQYSPTMSPPYSHTHKLYHKTPIRW